MTMEHVSVISRAILDIACVPHTFKARNLNGEYRTAVYDHIRWSNRRTLAALEEAQRQIKTVSRDIDNCPNCGKEG